MLIYTEYGNIDSEELKRLYGDLVKEEILKGYTFPTKPSTDGYFHINIKDNKTGKRKQLKAKTLSELKEKVLELHKKESAPLKQTFKDIFAKTQEENLLYVKDKEKKLSISNSNVRRSQEYNRYFKGTAFEKLDVREITKLNIEEICLYNLQKYDMRKKAFLGLRGIIKGVLSYAYSNYLIDENPYLRVDFKSRKFTNMLSDDVDIDDRDYSEEEIAKVLTYIREYEKKKPSYMVPYALELQILAGLRRGEIPPLTKSDINMDNLTIYICKEQLTVRTKKGEGDILKIVDHTKTWKNRYFPITNELEEYFGRLFETLDRYYKDSPYLFPADTDLGVITNYMVYGFYSKMCKKLGIRIIRDVTRGPHAFRRNAESAALLKVGGNIELVTPIFGNTPTVARKHYCTSADAGKIRELLNA